MICRLVPVKRKRKDGSSRVEYHARYRPPGEHRGMLQRSLQTSDKRVAETKLAALRRELEYEAANLLPPKPMREAADRSVLEHLADHLTELRSRKRSKSHMKHVRQYVARLVRECGWKRLHDVTAESFEAWRRRQDEAAPKTINEYRNSIGQLMRWLVDEGKMPANPLARVKPRDVAGYERRKRRALSIDEQQRLVAVATGERRVVWQVAIYTGLRRGEMKRLQWGDADLDSGAGKSRLNVLSSTTKNKKRAVIPLREDVAEALRTIRPENWNRTDRLFRGGIPEVKTLRKDLRKAGIPERDGDRGVVDVHALRHSCCTNQHRAGVPLAVAMRVMRHSDPKLTMKVYADADLLPVAEAYENAAPRFDAISKGQKRSSVWDANSRGAARKGTTKNGDKLVPDKGLRHDLARNGTTRFSAEKTGVDRNRTDPGPA